jgi:hypothetical protein
MSQKSAMEHANERGRRAFLRGTGAAMSAALVPAVAAVDATAADRTREDAGLIRQLYRDWAACLAGQRRREYADLFSAESETCVPGGLLRLMQDPAQPSETIEFAADRRSAVARFHCLAQIAAPLRGNASVVEMARLQGQHDRTWWESGIHELDCVKTGAAWKIRNLAYRRSTAVPSVLSGVTICSPTR